MRRLSEEEQYLREVAAYPLLTQREERDYARRARAGERAARERLVCSNLRLVIAFAKRMATTAIPIREAIAEGNVGLLVAADRFDPEMGFRFTTYAVWWIRQAILRANADRGRLIRVPAYMGQIMRRWRIVRDRLMRDGEVPSDAAIARELGISYKMMERVREARVTRETIFDLDRVWEQADDVAQDPTHRAETEDELRSARAMLAAHLTDRDCRIMVERALQGKTYREIAVAEGLSRERIRQILEEVRGRLAGGGR